MIIQGRLSVIRQPKPAPKKKRWTWEDQEPPPKEDEPGDTTHYNSRGYPLYQDNRGDWRIDPTKLVKKGSAADGSRPLDPHPFEVWERVANPDGTLKPEAMRADGPEPQKRITVVYRYADDMPVAGALCSVYDQNDSLVGGGPIKADLETVFPLPRHVNHVTVELHDDPLIQAYLRQPLPNPETPKVKRGWLERMTAALTSAGDWASGVIAGDFNEEPTLSQIITNTVITMIPLVDQAADLRDIAASLHRLIWVENGYQDYLAWVGLGLTMIGLFPTVGSLAKGVLKAVFFKLPLDSLIKTFNALAKGHAGKYLKKLQNGGLKEMTSQAVKKTGQILDTLYDRMDRLKNKVPDFLVGIKDKISAILHALDECARRLDDMFTRFFDELAENLNRAMGQKFELAFESVPNSTVAYKQVKQEPPVFKVESGVEKEYADVVESGPKTTRRTGVGATREGIPIERVKPKVLKEVHLDSKAAYGYSPNKGTAYEKIDFTDVDAAKKNRKIRTEYLDGSMRLENDIKTMRAEGASSEEIGRHVVNERNIQKIDARKHMKPDEIKVLEERNLKKYDNPIGPTADDMFEATKDNLIDKGLYESDTQVWDRVIEKSMKKDDVINTLLGIEH